MGLLVCNLLKEIKLFIKKNIIEVIIAIVVITIHLILALNFKGLTQQTGYDEPATIAWTGLLTKASWYDIICKHKYYGFGFSILLSVLYNITTDPVILSIFMQVFIAILYAISAVLCYKIIENLILLETKKQILIAIFFSIAAVFVPFKFPCIINEHMYILINWCIIYILVKLIQQKEKRGYYSIYLILILGYSLAVHEKAITLWAGVIIAIIFINVVFSTSTLKWGLFGGLGMIIYKNMKKLTKHMRNIYWGSGANSVANTSSGTLSTVLKKVKNLKNPLNWVFPIVTFFSQIYFMSMCTGGVFLVAFMMSIYFVFYILKKRKTAQIWQKQILVIIIYSFVCILITIAIQAISWMPNVDELEAERVMIEMFGKRAKLYLRYFCCYCGPLIMLFAIYLIKYYEKLKKIYVISMVIYVLLSVGEIVAISPWYGEFVLGSSPVYSMFLPFSWKSAESYLTQETFVLSLIVAFIVTFFLFLMFLLKRKIIFSIMLTILFIYQYLYIGFDVYVDASEKMYEENYPVYEVLNEIKEQTKGLVYMPKMKKSDLRLKYYLTEFTVLYVKPTREIVESEGIIVILNNDGELNQYTTKKGYQYIFTEAYEIYLSPDIELPQNVNTEK